MAINLAVAQFADKIAKKFVSETFLHGKLNGDYTFDGFKSVTIVTPVTSPLVDYTRTGIARFGTPTDVQDEVQTVALQKDRSFSKIIDKANNSEQLKLKKAGEIMSLQIKREVGPEMDKFGFKVFAETAGQVALNVEPTKATIVGFLSDALTLMDEEFVPDEKRFIYLPAKFYNMVRLSTEVLGIDLINAKAIGKGVVAEFMGAYIVKIPTTFLPTNVWFLVAHQDSACLPIKLETLRILSEAPGIDGSLLEYHGMYGAYVLSARNEGVVVNCATALRVGATTITPTGASHAITNATGSAVIYYTLDGSDPRYSATRIVYASAVTLVSGQTIKAVGTKADMVNGAVASAFYA